MMTKLASACLALLISSNAAVAHNFAKPPIAESRMAVPLPVVNRADVEKALAARRDHNIAAFRAYMNAGVYPHNTVRPGPLNVWRDDDGHLCAAATMIDRDGKHALVTKTAEQTDYLRLLDVTTGPLLDWIMTSGLSIEEIDRIQAPMVLPNPSEQDPSWQAREDAKLRAGYVATSKWLDKHRAAGLSAAVDRLMAYPLLAQKLVAGTI
jgi:hypothetical protein